jgi:hypothetical protein
VVIGVNVVLHGSKPCLPGPTGSLRAAPRGFVVD